MNGGVVLSTDEHPFLKASFHPLTMCAAPVAKSKFYDPSCKDDEEWRDADDYACFEFRGPSALSPSRPPVPPCYRPAVSFRKATYSL